MSIINEALKKAQKGNRFLAKHRPHRIRFRQLWLTALGIVCLLGAILVFNSFKAEDPAGSVSIHETISELKSSSRAFGLKELDIETPLKPAYFNLSGIVYDEQMPLAIINNRIVNKGMLINGAEVLTIKPSYVLLSLKGEELTLKIK